MEPQALEFLKNILEMPSPSGYERPAQEIVRQYAAGLSDEVVTDVHSNVIAARNPGAPLRVMLAGHCGMLKHPTLDVCDVITMLSNVFESAHPKMKCPTGPRPF